MIMKVLSRTLPVVEVISPTIQGEGPNTGRRICLIRLGGCNLTCAGCDTRYAWDGTEPIPDLSIADIGGQLQTNRPFHQVVITGGEPLIHQSNDAFRYLILMLLDAEMSVEIETNGTITPAEWLTQWIKPFGEPERSVSFVVSPKLFGGLASDEKAKRIKSTPLYWFRDNRARFKIVCRTTVDVDQVGEWADTFQISRDRIWVMAEGATWGDHLSRARSITSRTLDAGMNVSTRLHLALWPAETRGH